VSAATDRRALEELRLRELLAGAHWTGPFPVLKTSTTTTNADAADLARAGAASMSCVVAEEQTAGRGRLDRVWVSPEFGGLWMSVVIHNSDVDPARWMWLPLAAGLAARDAIVDQSGIDVALKWPNDLVLNPQESQGALRKIGGVLSERLSDIDAFIVGIGINVAITDDELPTREASSLLVAGGRTDREELLAGVLVALDARVSQWRSGDPLLEVDYLRACASIGRQVSARLPGGETVTGLAADIAPDGALVINTPDGKVLSITAGDVIHATITP
jgi:BirA family transcriptional regulator, biotin operon repressor / biotin---[acetyl-CoA-carboxylase] ligase